MLVRAARPARALVSPRSLYAWQTHRRSRAAQRSALAERVWRCGAASAPIAIACPRSRGGQSGGAPSGRMRAQVTLARVRF